MTTRKSVQAKADRLRLAFPDYAKSRKSASDVPMAIVMDADMAPKHRGTPRDLTGLSTGSPLPDWTREGSAFDPSEGFADMRSAPPRGQVMHPKVNHAEVWPKTSPIGLPDLKEFRPAKSRKRGAWQSQSEGY